MSVDTSRSGGRIIPRFCASANDSYENVKTKSFAVRPAAGDRDGVWSAMVMQAL
jgi:hypothetical protein